MRTLGIWAGHREIEIVEVEGRPIALSGWNGEQYLQCWEVEEIISGTGFGVKEDGLCVRPVYKQIDNDEWKIIGYEFC